MDNIQVDYALSRDPYTKPYWRGVYAVNYLPKEPVPWPSAFVIATKSIPTFSTNHWISLYITPGGEGEIFDPHGCPPRHPLLKEFLRRNTVRTVYNRAPVQGVKPVCGNYSLYFLMNRCRGLNPNYILGQFCPDSELNDDYVEMYTRHRLIPGIETDFL